MDTPGQVRRWREAGGGACDVMVDTGMNRLGISVEDVAAGLLDGLTIETLMSHLACADERQHDERGPARPPHRVGRPYVRAPSQPRQFGRCRARPRLCLRSHPPGLALYGGVPSPALGGVVRSVATIEAEVLQRRRVRAGETVGYNARWTAPADSWVGIVNLGYADGYWRGFTNTGRAFAGDAVLPVIGRVSMDLVALDLGDTAIGEGDRVTFDPICRARLRHRA
ncbi:alanine racemase [Sphingomonas sp. MMS24-JH45]